MDEEWRPVPGWPGYEVSDRHRVRSVDRTLSDGRRAGGMLLKQRRDRRGRDGKGRMVKLSDGSRSRTVRVYVLVAEAFISPRPPGMQILHKNDDHGTTDVDSLSYGTARKNVRERVRRERKEKGKGKRKEEGEGSKGREKRETGEIGRVAYRVSQVAPPIAPGQDGGL